MFYRNELSFLCEVFEKHHLGASFIDQEELIELLSADRSEDFLRPNKLLLEHLPTLSPHTLYLLTDSFELCYAMLLLPDTKEPTVFYCGPYLSAPISPQRLLELGEENGVSPQKQRYLAEYYASIPVLSAESPLRIMLHVFCERIWRTPTFSILELSKHGMSDDDPIHKPMSHSDPADTLVNMKAMERRYAFENEIIRAVELGHSHMEDSLRTAFSSRFLEKRVADPLRNAKNYAIIMNTLLRKAAERGGVHPLYLDRVSSEYALKIEGLSALSLVSTLMCEMFRSYCRLVRKHALQSFSPVVQKTILIIDADLAADLSPNRLAASQGITLGYLSDVFRKETGETLSAFIRRRRMRHARHLLRTTNLQIQSIALHCGIMDVQYFSKLFKKEFGQTPSEYRLAQKYSE